MNILNIVNFIRGVEPRDDKMDLLLPVQKQWELVKKYNFAATFLFQHDALFNKKFTDLIVPSEKIEVGLWLELNKDLVEKAGGTWTGREGYFWDWHSDKGLTVGYSPELRIKIIDCAMNDFKSVFGFYPKTVAAWSIDAVSLKHLETKYQIDASMNCKEQWGTDGYSMWGGYFSQAYYPSLNNCFCPANSIEKQINIPIFRMLGSDPIDQYFCESDDNGQNVVSLEPVYPESGGNKEWIEWFFRENFNNKSLSFGYAQAGQENSFGWSAMEKGYLLQFEHIKEKINDGIITLMTVSEAGRWYKEKFPLTPASSVVARKDDGRMGIWYCSRYYRSNIYVSHNTAYFQDIMVFDDRYKERYLNDTCKSMNMYYDTLPVIDSYRCSINERSGGFFTDDGKVVEIYGDVTTEEIDNSTLQVKIPTRKVDILVTYSEEEISIDSPFELTIKWDKCDNAPKTFDNGIDFIYENYKYKMIVKSGAVCLNKDEKQYVIKPVNKKITLMLKQEDK